MACVGSLAMLTGCMETVNTHGQIMLPSKLEQVKPGETTKQDMLNLFGTPSAQGTLNDNRWYYVTTVEGTTPFTPHIIKDRSVYVADFDATGKVTRFAKLTAEDGKALAPAAEATPTRGQAQGLLQQMFGNIGQMMGK